MGVHPGRDDSAWRNLSSRDVRERFEGGHRHERASLHEGQPLHRGNAGPQTRERARPGPNGEHVDGAQRHAGVIQQVDEVSRQPLGMRARRVPGPFNDDAIVVDDRDASGASRRIQSQDTRMGYTKNVSTSV